MSVWRLIPFRTADAFENMATDEAIFRLMPLGRTPPTIRFYGWHPAAISLGYFQDIHRECNLDACRREQVDVVRRPTGGKAVFHEGDLTYALSARVDEGPFPPDVLGTYRIICRCLQEGLRRLGIETTSAAVEHARHPDRPAACFALPSQFELLVQGRKMCGSAQARTQGAFLQHGSLLIRFDAERTARLLLPDEGERERMCTHLREAVTAIQDYLRPPPAKEVLTRILAEGFAEILHADLQPGGLSPDEEILRDRLLREKYRHGMWNREGKGTRDRIN